MSRQSRCRRAWAGQTPNRQRDGPAADGGLHGRYQRGGARRCAGGGRGVPCRSRHADAGGHRRSHRGHASCGRLGRVTDILAEGCFRGPGVLRRSNTGQTDASDVKVTSPSERRRHGGEHRYGSALLALLRPGESAPSVSRSSGTRAVCQFEAVVQAELASTYVQSSIHTTFEVTRERVRESDKARCPSCVKPSIQARYRRS